MERRAQGESKGILASYASVCYDGRHDCMDDCANYLGLETEPVKVRHFLLTN